MKTTTTLLLATLAACGSYAPGMPLAAVDAGSPIDGAAPHPRLIVGPNGIIDTALGIPCAWGLDSVCVKRCFPLEPLWPACDGQGRRYLYTRQGLTAVYRYGRETHRVNPACRGEDTQTLVALLPLTDYDINHIVKPQSCDGQYDYSANIRDRQWYLAGEPDIQAATTDDL